MSDERAQSDATRVKTPAPDLDALARELRRLQTSVGARSEGKASTPPEDGLAHNLATGENLHPLVAMVNGAVNPVRQGYGASKALRKAQRDIAKGKYPQAALDAAEAGLWTSGAGALADMATLAPSALKIAKVGFREVPPEQNYEAMMQFLKERPDEAGFLTVRDPAQMRAEGMRTFLSRDGKSGYAVEPTSGDIRNVFNRPNGEQGAGAVAVASALGRKGGGRILDAFDTNLGNFYRDMGFKETERLPWNPEYAPAGWNTAKYGTPDVMMMQHPRASTMSAARMLKRYNAARAARKTG